MKDPLAPSGATTLDDDLIDHIERTERMWKEFDRDGRSAMDRWEETERRLYGPNFTSKAEDLMARLDAAAGIVPPTKLERFEELERRILGSLGVDSKDQLNELRRPPGISSSASAFGTGYRFELPRPPPSPAPQITVNITIRLPDDAASDAAPPTRDPGKPN